jgi:hypothetical protein
MNDLLKVNYVVIDLYCKTPQINMSIEEVSQTSKSLDWS